MNGFDQLNWFQPCYYNLFSHAMAYEALISERIVALRRKKSSKTFMSTNSQQFVDIICQNIW